MNILNEPVPGHWPAEAKTLVNDLRRAYRALEREIEQADPIDETPDDDEIAQEAMRYGFTVQEATVWRKLRENQGKYVSRDQIYSAMYGNRTETIIDKSVDVYICKVRGKLKAASAPYTIECKHGVGRRLMSHTDNLAAVEKVSPRQHPLLSARIGAFVDQSDLAALCWAADIKSADLAKMMNVKPNTVHGWSGGHMKMPAARCVEAANIFKAKQSELLKATGAKPKLAA